MTGTRRLQVLQAPPKGLEVPQHQAQGQPSRCLPDSGGLTTQQRPVASPAPGHSNQEWVSSYNQDQESRQAATVQEEFDV